MSICKDQLDFQPRKWQRKVLYAPEFQEKQQMTTATPHQHSLDNLSSAEIHSAVPYTLRHVIYHACAVSQHVNCTILYAATLLAYAEADDTSDWLKFYCSNPQALFLGNALLITLILCAGAKLSTTPQKILESKMAFIGQGDFKNHDQATSLFRGIKSFMADFFHTFRSFVIFTAFNFALSPILASLTQSVSTDSIYFLASSSFLLNAFLQNYQTSPQQCTPTHYNNDRSRFTMNDGDKPSKVARGEDQNVATDLKATLTSRLRPPAFNSALFGSICLASRLPPSPYHAFTATSLSALVFGLWPDLRASLKCVWGAPWQEIYTALLIALTALSIYTMPTTGFDSYPLVLAIAALILNLIITLAIPILFVRMQVYKNVIHGPWDEAIITPHI